MIQEVSLITVVVYSLKNNHFIKAHNGIENGNSIEFINYAIKQLKEFEF